MNTPTTLADLQHLTNVFPVDTAGVGIAPEAMRVFEENYGGEYRPDLALTVGYLFTEDDSEGNQVNVYEAYKDSGSNDYIYLTAKI